MSKNDITPKKCKLKDLMKEQNLTQTELSNLSGVPQTVISRYSRGSESCSPAYLFALADALGLEHIGELFEDA